jgi:hypothetical protein
MRMDFDELGTVAFDEIRHHIETGERQDLRVLPSVLIERESTAPPRTATPYRGSRTGPTEPCADQHGMSVAIRV